MSIEPLMLFQVNHLIRYEASAEYIKWLERDGDYVQARGTDRDGKDPDGRILHGVYVTVSAEIDGNRPFGRGARK